MLSLSQGTLRHVHCVTAAGCPRSQRIPGRPLYVHAVAPDASDSPTGAASDGRVLVPRTRRSAPRPAEPQPVTTGADDEARPRRSLGRADEGGERRQGYGDRRDGWQREGGEGRSRGDRREDGWEDRGRRGRGDDDRRRESRSRGPRGQGPPRDQEQEPRPPVDPRLKRTPRYLALQQLMRIERDGAYIGLVSGSPHPGQQQQQQPGTRGGAATGDLDEMDDSVDVDREGGEGGQGQGGRGPPPLDPRDQRLVKELVAGVTRLQRRLDYIAAKLSGQTPGDWEASVRMIVRLGLFELTERRLPGHALNEHVTLAKALVRQGAGGFVNGVLRSAARALEADNLPTPESEPITTSPPASPSAAAKAAVRRLALQYSHPTWLVSRWLPRFGPDATPQLLQHNNTPPVYTVRINPLRLGGGGRAGPGGGRGSRELVQRVVEDLTRAGVDAEPSPYLPGEFIRVRSGLQRLLAEGWVSSGRLTVQDESAGLVVALLDPQPGERILDCCAAPGGKTLFAAARMGGRGSVTALDVSASKLRALAAAAEAAGAGHMVSTRAADLREYSQRVQQQLAWQQEQEAERGEAARGEEAWAGGVRRGGGAGGGPRVELYDKVLLDAPCTGSGVLSKRADLRWRRTPEDLTQLVGLQDELLDAAAGLVAPGGVLVYSTCSIEEEEDAGRVAAFLARHPEFEVDQAEPVEWVAETDTEGRRGQGKPQAGKARGGSGGMGLGLGVPLPAPVVTAQGYLATLPHVHGTDGAFGARLRRLR